MGKKTNLLTFLIFLGLVLGVLVGHYALWDAGASPEGREQAVAAWKTMGDLVFVRPLRLLIIPLVFTSVLTGITSIGDPKRLGLLGGATLVYYIVTMIIAVVVGVTIGAIFQPGSGFPDDLRASMSETAAGMVGGISSEGGGLSGAWLAILHQMIPINFFQAAVEGQALSIITATIFLGVGIVAIGEKAEPFTRAIEALHEVLMLLVQWVIWIMPLGVFLLVAWAVGNIGLVTLTKALSRYIVCVVGGLSLHMFVTLPVVLFLLARTNPYRFMWRMKTALLTAFGTSSSMATLPVTIETSTEEAGCSRRASGLVLPLGATVNMDGTALYQGIAVIFLFQAFGIDLHFTEYLAIVLTATLAAVGAAGVPGGSIATILIIITAVNSTLGASGENAPQLPLAAIGLILPVDRILDMCRTMVNVWGDSVGARIITRLAPDEEEEREAAYA
ncbi:MAG: dicarboxylate/amino acid:cation symporter [Phycisphaeraceae bacterium]|nr:dicarboxylate/amino acid:cation symporter [Phycisphaeraceae bacterium]